MKSTGNIYLIAFNPMQFNRFLMLKCANLCALAFQAALDPTRDPLEGGGAGCTRRQEAEGEGGQAAQAGSSRQAQVRSAAAGSQSQRGDSWQLATAQSRR